MTSFAINAPLKKGNIKPLWVWFTGVGALKEGQGLCYDAHGIVAGGYAVEGTADARRYNKVALPTADLAGHFAGVASRAYSAKTGGQLIEIYGPGSVCNVLTYNVTTVLANSTALVCSYDATGTTGSCAGTFKTGAATGKAGALALQSKTGTAAFALVLAVLQEGAQLGVAA